MNLTLVAVIAIMTVGCSSMGGECREALDSGNWAAIEAPASLLPNDRSVRSDQHHLAFLDEATGTLAVCSSCDSTNDRIESVKYYENKKLIRATVKSCGPY